MFCCHGYSGVCASCGVQLEPALTKEDHQQLLDATITAIHSQNLGFSPEIISNLSRLNTQLTDAHPPYRVIVDGLNVSRVGTKNSRVSQVRDVGWVHVCDL